MTLYHFTCAHSLVGIEVDGGAIRPRRHPLLGFAVVWLTADRAATAAHLGLASHDIVKCDRMAFRYVIDNPIAALPWVEFRSRLPIEAARTLEAARGARPGLWYVSRAVQYGRLS